MRYSVSIDVPSLDAGLKFYGETFGIEEVARPVPVYAILKCGSATLGLMEKAAGTKPAPGSGDIRRYERHWTPVHVDFHVEDFEGVLARAVSAGAVVEQKHEISGRPPIAFCADPFGNGFCIIGDKAKR